jgi:prolyl-tRNA synthetase
VLLPIAAHKPGVMEKAKEVYDMLKAGGLRVELDDRDTVSAGWKFNEWELKGVPVRLELGPRDIEAGMITCARRDTFEKSQLPLDGLAGAVNDLLSDIHINMLAKACKFSEAHTYIATDMESLSRSVQDGFVKAAWCGERECEDAIKEQTGATSRYMPFDQSDMPSDTCVYCGKPAMKLMFFAKAY